MNVTMFGNKITLADGTVYRWVRPSLGLTTTYIGPFEYREVVTPLTLIEYIIEQRNNDLGGFANFIALNPVDIASMPSSVEALSPFVTVIEGLINVNTIVLVEHEIPALLTVGE